MSSIDCRNMPCPVPVIKVKKALENNNGEPVTVLADNGAARENIIRLARDKGFTVDEEGFDDYCSLTLKQSLFSAERDNGANSALPPVLLISSERLGEGADELGRLLMKNFIMTLVETATKPGKIYFINSGVLLATEGSEVTEPLLKLSAAGVEIFSCGVCLDYFAVREKLVVGTITTMYSIAETMLKADNSIRL